MIATKNGNGHSSNAVSRITRPYAEFEIFYLDGENNLKRRKVKAKTIRGAIGKARIDRLKVVDASIRSNGSFKPVKLDKLDSVMGV